MRGDSLRDLYAKTLAIVGLGLLAATGAIVDYWPVGGELPAVPGLAAFRPVAVAVAHVQRDVPAPQVVGLTRVAMPRTHRVFTDSLRTVKFVAVDQPAAPARPLEAPIPDASFVTIDEAATRLASMIEIELDVTLPPDELTATVQPEPHWSFVGAIKRTRESLKDARVFIGGKLGGVVGAFRKVSPFWDTTTVTQLR